MRIALSSGESTNFPIMNITRIYQALTCPTPPAHLARVGSPFAAASVLTLLIRIEGVPLLALSYSARDLQGRFPHDRVPDCAQDVFKQELSRYRAWRRTIFDLFLLETGSLADHDPIAGLRRITRLEYGGRTDESLRSLGRALPGGFAISQLTFTNALQIDKALGENLRPPFRAALSLLDRLQDAPLAAGSRHLLPAATIGTLPAPSSHLYHAPLPPRLDAAYASAPPRVRAAVPFVYRLCRCAGLLSEDQDPTLEDLARTSMLLWDVAPNEYGFQKPSQVALKSYIRHIGQHAGTGHTPPAPVQATAPQGWADLRACMRQYGFEKLIQRTFGVSKLAIRDELPPAKITPQWIQKTLQNLPRQERNAFRSGLFVLDDLILDEAFPQDVLPREVSGLARKREPRRT